MPSLITVVVPLYNKRSTLMRCLLSVLRQTVEQLELLVVNDGSTDGSEDLVRQIRDPRLRLLEQPNSGVSTARNAGAAWAHTDLVAFLDADDEWQPGFLQAILDLRREFPTAGIYATGIGRCWADGRPDLLLSAATPPGRNTVLIDDYLDAVREGDFVSSSNIAIPRRLFEETGGFPAGEPLGEDRDLWARIAVHRPVACDARILAFYFTPRQRQERPAGDSVPLLPPAVVSLSRLLDAGLVPEPRIASARAYIDWAIIQRADDLLWRQDRLALLRFLAYAPLLSPAGRRRALLLRGLARLLPPRLARAVRLKLSRLFRALGRLVPLSARRNRLVSRQSPCVHSAGNCRD